MAANSNKQQLLAQVQTVLKKKIPAPPEPLGERQILEEVIYAILREGATAEQANTAYQTIRTAFYDWNEVRVSSVQEVADAAKGLAEAGAKGQRIVSFLQEVFDELYSFDLNDISKKGVKQAARQLARYKSGVTDFVVAWVTQRSLNGHAIPLDAATMRVLKRMGVVEPDAEDYESARSTVEHYIPKANGQDFTDRFIHLALDFCLPVEPKCHDCPLHKDCITGQDNITAAKAREKEKAKDEKAKQKGKG